MRHLVSVTLQLAAQAPSCGQVGDYKECVPLWPINMYKHVDNIDAAFLIRSHVADPPMVHS